MCKCNILFLRFHLSYHLVVVLLRGKIKKNRESGLIEAIYVLCFKRTWYNSLLRCVLKLNM